MDKSYVSLELCYYCNEPKGIVLDTTMADSLPRQAVFNTEPCDKCADLMEQGIMFISVRDGEPERLVEAKIKARQEWERNGRQGEFYYIDNPYRTGRTIVISEEAVARAGMDTKQRVYFVEDSLWEDAFHSEIKQ